MKGSRYFNIYLFFEEPYASEVELCAGRGVGQPCDLGGLTGGSINTTSVRFSANILCGSPLFFSTTFRHVSGFPSPPSTPVQSLR